VEQIDLFQLHRVDPRVPAEEQFGLLKALRDEGKVREVGLSEVNGDQIDEALGSCRWSACRTSTTSAQRGADDVIDHCERHQLGFIPWGPLASGKLADPGGPLDRLAQALGATVSQVGLAWLLRRSPVMLPIPGTSTLAHLEENCAAADITLSDAQFEELSEARKQLRRWAAGR
jgi:pyridoxine 4-dehydrogenase